MQSRLLQLLEADLDPAKEKPSKTKRAPSREKVRETWEPLLIFPTVLYFPSHLLRARVSFFTTY